MALDGVDPNIALQAGRNLPQPGPNWDQVQAMQRTAISLQQAQQVQDAQNALKTLYTNPKNFDPKTFQPTQEAWGQLFRMSPAAGMDLRNNLATLQQKQAVVANQQQEANSGWVKRGLDEVGKPALDEYNTAIAENVPPQVAIQRAQKVYTDNLKTLQDSGMPDVLKSQMSPTFDPIRIGKNLQTIQQQQEQEKLKTEGYTKTTQMTPDGPQEVYVNPDPKKPTLNMAGLPTPATSRPVPPANEQKPVKAETTDGKTIDVIRDPNGMLRDYFTNQPINAQTIKPGSLKGEGTGKDKTPAQLAIDKFVEENPNATADQLANFTQKMRPPRSGAAAAVQKFMDENPNASAADIAAFNAWTRETGAGAQAFGTGPQGNLTRAQNVAIDHLAFLSDDLVPALKNGDMRAVNALTNWAKTEFGHEGPVDFNFAKGIVSQEVNKSIVNTGAGTEAERANLSAALSAANSPEQLNGVIASAKRLMAGQLKGLQQQYVDVTVGPGSRGDPAAVQRAQDSFQQKLFPRTLQELRIGAPGESQAGKEVPITPTAKAPAGTGGVPEITEQQYNTLPPGSPYRIPGNPTVMYK
jgi:hypothetical protein